MLNIVLFSLNKSRMPVIEGSFGTKFTSSPKVVVNNSGQNFVTGKLAMNFKPYSKTPLAQRNRETRCMTNAFRVLIGGTGAQGMNIENNFV